MVGEGHLLNWGRLGVLDGARLEEDLEQQRVSCTVCISEQNIVQTQK